MYVWKQQKNVGHAMLNSKETLTIQMVSLLLGDVLFAEKEEVFMWKINKTS